MFKNTAAQKLTVLAFADAGHASLDAGEKVTGDAANITLKIEQDDDGTRSASNDVNPTETEDGQYTFDLTQAETNGDKLTFYPESATAGVQVVAVPSNVIYTRPPNFPALGIETDGHVHADVKEWLGVAPLALSSQRVQSHLGGGDSDVITATLIAADAIGTSELATDAVNEIRNAITGGAYALDTDANGAIRIVDGTGARELDTNLGLIAGIAGTLNTFDDLNNLSTADVDARLAAIGLDHLVSASVTGTDIADDSIIAQMVSSAATADWDTFVNTDDSLQAISESGGGGPTAADIADAVWDEVQADHVAAGSFGEIASEIASILADTGTDGVVVNSAGLATDAVNEIRNAVTGGAYALDTDANGAVRIVDGTGARELDTSLGLIAGIAGTKNTFDDLNDIDGTAVNLANGAHGGASASLQLGGETTTPPFRVQNSGGVAVKFESTGGTGHGLDLIGFDTGSGLRCVGLGGAGLTVTNPLGDDVSLQFTAANFAASAIDANALATDAVNEIRNAITGGAYALDTDANGRARIVDGVGAGELDTDSGTVLLRAATEAQIDAIETDSNELQTDWADGGRLDLILDSIKSLLDDARAEPGQGAPPVNPDMATKVDYLYKAWRNKKAQTSTTFSLFADGGATVDQKSIVSDDGTTFEFGELVTGP